jgi:FlaA1/EpsC-like NDP-sugar epimerase
MHPFARSTAPRWVIFTLDVGICIFSLILAYNLRFNFDIPDHEIETIPVVLTGLIFIRIVSFIISKTYAGIIRYTSTGDAQRIFTVILAGSITLAIINPLHYFFINDRFFIPYSIVIIDFISTVFLLITFRIGVKSLFFELKKPANREQTSIMIYGADTEAITVKKALDRDAETKFTIVGLIDYKSKNSGKKIDGTKIYPTKAFSEALENEQPDQLIIAQQNISDERKRLIIEQCLSKNIKVLNVPPSTKWINGELSFKQIKSIRIEDLIGRASIELDEKEIIKQHGGNTILVSGAAGSIGSEMVRQIIKYNPKKIILLDQAESALYELEFELSKHIKNNVCEVVIGDIRNEKRLRRLFEKYKPSRVYHAAAYKHVPLMEENPSEAIRTNILGTKNMADLAHEFNAEEFVLISTDKAVNPTNVMGASKRIAEIYTQSLNAISKTKFITTRFGNVLGSNGSVIPLFRKQIENGGPITVTHPDITRFFMTIPEACKLVLEAGTMGKGGEIFIFDMGKSVKIIDLAKKMIKLSGLELGKDIQIEFSGLRPGEKLYEELLADKENTLPTHHNQIMIAKVRGYEFDKVSQEVIELTNMYNNQNNTEIVEKMKLIVPEYISKNSEFEALDSK